MKNTTAFFISFCVCIAFSLSINTPIHAQTNSATITSIDTFLMQAAKVIIAETIDEDDNTYKYIHPKNGYSRYLKKAEIIAINRDIKVASVQIVLKDGTILTGELVSYSEVDVQLETNYSDAILDIKLAEITSIKAVDISAKTAKTRNNKAIGLTIDHFKQPIHTRYFFGTNALSMKKGTGYYQNTWVFFNQAAVGVTDNISVGGGIVPTVIFGSGLPTPIWGTAKIGLPIKSKNFHFAVGTLFGNVIGEDSGSFGLLFSQTTFGNTENNITFALGYGIIGGKLAERPTISFNAAYKVSERVALITENYPLVGTNLSLYSLGARFYMRGASLDVALVNLRTTFDTGDNDFTIGIPLPWLGFSIPFGKY